MKRYIACLTLICSTMFASQSPALEKLIPFKKYLDAGNRNGMDYSRFSRLPQSRFHTFKTAFRHFEQTNGRVIVELGTSRSFVDGGYVGCNEDNPKYWEPNNPGKWDWGAGFFTYLSAHCLGHLKPEIHTVDLIGAHINRCKVITGQFNHMISYHVSDSVKFLKRWKKQKKIDLLYLDTGDITPVEPTAQLHLREAKVIVKRDLVARGGLILIDDVMHPAPMLIDGDTTGLGKAKYSIPYFLENGFELIQDEFQYVLRKR